jgi:alpha-methylacyl-CoA racemase
VKLLGARALCAVEEDATLPLCTGGCRTVQRTLTGIRVLDLSRLLPGPFCSMILADLGAEVIKVESHMVGDPARSTYPHVGGQSCYFMSINRNKKSLALNLRRTEGREVFLKLAGAADVIIEGFKPGRATSLGIGYDDIRPLNPGIVYCSLSGYGQSGPFKDRAGHNVNYVALAGMLDLMGLPGAAPVTPGVQLADIGGALFAAVGILSALVARSVRGTGTYVDASLFHSVVSMMTYSAATLISTEAPLEPRQPHLSGDLPCYNVYQTKDGRYMALGALEAVFWGDFCEAIGRNDLISKQFPEKAERESVISEMQSLFAQRTKAEWIQFFAEKNVCCEPVNTLEEALSTSVLMDRGMMWEVDHPTAGRLQQIGSPLRSVPRQAGRTAEPSEGLQSLPSDSKAASPAPLLGQHTVEILESLGYEDETIQQLRTKRVVATPEDIAARRNRTL